MSDREGLMEQLKKTALHDFHRQSGAQMAQFGEYEMPLWYRAGVKAEHLAVIRRVGIFDTSHMAAVLVQGQDARILLQRCLSKDLEHAFGHGRPLVDGRCVYGIIPAPDGTVIDDAICYQLHTDCFMVVVNSSMGARVARHFAEQTESSAASITDLTASFGKMDIQGPAALRVLMKIVRNPTEVFAAMPYFGFAGGEGLFGGEKRVELDDGTPILVSRTGYTGEFGFELYCGADQLVSLWTKVIAAGAEFAVLPCGLAARDSLRAGAGLPLSHQDIGPWPFLNNPWQFALPWRQGGKGFTKDFIGAAALQDAEWTKHTLAFAGFDPRKIAATGEGTVIDEESRPLGRILTCTTDMAIDRRDNEIVSVGVDPELNAKGLCCGFVQLEKKVDAGERVYLTDNKRKIAVEIRVDIRPGRSARRPLAEMVDIQF
jgi:aminomethyltransferase